MKATRTVWVALLIVFLVGFTTACQRSNENRVQAARENPYPAANPSADNMMTSEDKDIAMKIEQANLGEIDLGRWAKDHASNRDVRNYGDMMETDHTKALKDVQKIMTKYGVNESTQSKPVDAQNNLSMLQKLSGPAFDREYMNMMVSDHQKDLEELKSAQTSVQNADLKDYINDFIPVVQKHLEKAQDLQTKLTSSGR